MTHPEHIAYVNTSLIDPFPDHPYNVFNNAELEYLAESIHYNGVLSPLLLRLMPNGRYVLISGHRRLAACTLLNKDTVPALIYTDISDDEAIVLMVDCNLNRENLLPSEKARAYKMKNDALKRQAGRPSKNGGQSVHDYYDKKTREMIGEASGESGRQIQRYIRLNKLIPELLTMVDEDKLPFTAGVDLSYLSTEHQHVLLKEIQASGKIPNAKQAHRMKALSKARELTPQAIHDICEQMRLDDRVTFRLRPSSLEKLNEASDKLGADKSKLLRSYVNSGGVVAVVDGDVLAQIRQIHTDVSRIGSLLKWTAGSLADISDNPFIAQQDVDAVRSVIAQTKELQGELKLTRDALVKLTERLNKAARRINNGDI